MPGNAKEQAGQDDFGERHLEDLYRQRARLRTQPHQ